MVTRPIIQYHGGKWMLAPWIISHFPEHKIYVEPYGGAASVLLRKEPSHIEVYNDLNGDLVNLFKVLRNKDTALELIRLIELTPWARVELEESRKRSDDVVENCRRMIVESFMSRGVGEFLNGGTSGFRTYVKTNLEASNYYKLWRNMPQSIAQIVDRIQGNVIIENRDALDVMQQHDSEVTLHYVDPPYTESTRSDDGDDYAFEMTEDEHRKMAAVLNQLKGSVIVSGYACSLYDDELFKGWRRDIKSTTSGANTARVEVLWMKLNNAVYQEQLM